MKEELDLERVRGQVESKRENGKMHTELFS